MLIDKKILLDALKLTMHFSDKNSNNPILEATLINIKDNSITLSATDTKIGSEITIPTKYDDVETICIPAIRFYNMIHLIEENTINIDIDDKMIKVSTKSYKSQLKKYDADLFPNLFNEIPTTNITINADILNKAIKRTAFAAAVKGYKPEIEGINFITDETGISLCTTNSYRLSYFHYDTENSNSSDNFDIIIPKKFALELLNITENEKEIKIGITENYLSVESDNIKLFSRLIEGKFPNYSSMIKDKNCKPFSLPTDKFLKAVEKIIFITETPNYPIIFTLNDQKLNIKATNEEGEFAEENIDIDSNETFKFKFKLNGRMLFEYLTTIADKTIDLYYEAEKAPIMFISQETEYNSKYIQMPVD